MVDFRKLLEETQRETPEQRAERACQRDEAFAREIDRKLQERCGLVRRAGELARDGRERLFIDDLLRLAERDDPGTGLVGGRLLSLTDPQLVWLSDIANREETPKAGRSRAERYR